MTESTREGDVADLAYRIKQREACLESRRLRIVRISFDLWCQLLKGRIGPVTSTTCPEDLVVVNVHRGSIIPERLDVDVLVWSESFAPVPDGEEIPEADPFTYEIVYLKLGGPRDGDDSRLDSTDYPRACGACLVPHWRPTERSADRRLVCCHEDVGGEGREIPVGDAPPKWCPVVFLVPCEDGEVRA